MPNWCSNSLTVRGTQEDLEYFQKFVRSPRSKFDFDQVMPYPSEYARLDREPVVCEDGFKKDGFNRGGYGWCIQHWGTKWWVADVYLTEDVHELTFEFDTAWSPPKGVIASLVEWFPGLDFELHYEEPGCAFEGILVGFQGEIQQDDCRQTLYRSAYPD
jgi:hypothetical protein